MPPLFFAVPGIGEILEVKVLPQVDHSEPSEAQPREGDREWGGSAEQSRDSMNKNQVGGAADQGEREKSCETLGIREG